jgi:hypothetical protein
MSRANIEMTITVNVDGMKLVLGTEEGDSLIGITTQDFMNKVFELTNHYGQPTTMIADDPMPRIESRPDAFDEYREDIEDQVEEIEEYGNEENGNKVSRIAISKNESNELKKFLES